MFGWLRNPVSARPAGTGQHSLARTDSLARTESPIWTADIGQAANLPSAPNGGSASVLATFTVPVSGDLRISYKYALQPVGERADLPRIER